MTSIAFVDVRTISNADSSYETAEESNAKETTA